MLNNLGITAEEVKQVAKDLGMKEPSEAKVKNILSDIDCEADNDPTGTWQVWVENLLYNYDDTQELVDEVIEELKEQFREGDYTVVDEILKRVPREVLIHSLSEEKWKKFEK